MRWLAIPVAIALVACGDNEMGDGVPLARANDLVLIAHQDDDLLFMQPDIIEAVQRGDGVTNVYVTAGNGTKGTAAANIRYQGLKEAYGAAANEHDWSCGWIEILGHTAQHCRLEGAKVSLLFLAYPDGGVRGEEPASLLHLWEGTVASATTVADRTTTYGRDDLIATLAEIIRQTSPDVIHTLEVASTHGADEHADHMVVGALAVLALGRTTAQPALLAYRGYNTSGEPANKIQPIFDAIRAILVRYEACASNCGTCGGSCATIDPTHDTWLGRRYAIGFRRAATGALRSGGQCLLASGALGDCATAPIWSIDAMGELATAQGCLDVAADGSLAVDACTGGPDHRVFLDDEGHIWSAMPPAPRPAMDYAHLDCLAPGSDGVATAALCGQDSAPTWDVLPPLATTARAATAITATGRAVRLGDLTGDGLADLCTVTSAGLVCAPGDGAGHFGAAIRIGDLPIDPESLAIGDVDGDGLPDACGRASSGTVCALAATGFAGAPVSSTFGDQDARPDTATSLQIATPGEICGAAAQGVTCTPAGLSFQAALLSSWPDPAATIWPADLDGDGADDWCATTSSGPACGLAAEASTTTDGAPWMYASGGIAETVPDDPALTAVADIDGDGDADLCAIDGSDVMCARSQRRAFGPLATLLEAPVAPTALWLGDLDGDGRADACVDLGDTIACALSR